MELLDLITYATPPIIALSQTITTFYNNEKNTITKIVMFIKILFVLVTFGHLCYLYFYKKKTTIETSILLLLVLNIVTVIMIAVTIYLLFKNEIYNISTISLQTIGTKTIATKTIATKTNDEI
jgi:hypothetical protein